MGETVRDRFSEFFIWTTHSHSGQKKRSNARGKQYFPTCTLYQGHHLHCIKVIILLRCFKSCVLRTDQLVTTKVHRYATMSVKNRNLKQELLKLSTFTCTFCSFHFSTYSWKEIKNKMSYTNMCLNEWKLNG